MGLCPRARSEVTWWWISIPFSSLYMTQRQYICIHPAGHMMSQPKANTSVSTQQAIWCHNPKPIHLYPPSRPYDVTTQSQYICIHPAGYMMSQPKANTSVSTQQAVWCHNPKPIHLYPPSRLWCHNPDRANTYVSTQQAIFHNPKPIHLYSPSRSYVTTQTKPIHLYSPSRPYDVKPKANTSVSTQEAIWYHNPDTVNTFVSNQQAIWCHNPEAISLYPPTLAIWCHNPCNNTKPSHIVLHIQSATRQLHVLPSHVHVHLQLLLLLLINLPKPDFLDALYQNSVNNSSSLLLKYISAPPFIPWHHLYQLRCEALNSSATRAWHLCTETRQALYV